MVMNRFTGDELTAMRETQVSSLMDRCVIEHYGETANAYNEMIATYADGVEMWCGLDMRPGSERHNNKLVSLVYDATLRLAIDAVVDARDRIRITERFGEAVADELVYEIAGPVQRGPSGVRILLKKVDL